MFPVPITPIFTFTLPSSDPIAPDAHPPLCAGSGASILGGGAPRDHDNLSEIHSRSSDAAVGPIDRAKRSAVEREDLDA
jgi:hypothetical protein